MIAVDLRHGPSSNLVLVGGARPVLIDSGSGLAERGVVVFDGGTFDVTVPHEARESQAAQPGISSSSR